MTIRHRVPRKLKKRMQKLGFTYIRPETGTSYFVRPRNWCTCH